MATYAEYCWSLLLFWSGLFICQKTYIEWCKVKLCLKLWQKMKFIFFKVVCHIVGWCFKLPLLKLITICLCHAPRPTPRAWRSFHTSNPKAYNVTRSKQLSCNRKLPITKYLFRVAEQNLISSKFNSKTKTFTIQNPLSKYLQT